MGNSTSFTQAVDDAIRSTSPSMFGDSSLHSFGSLVDSLIRSNSASTITDAEFDLTLHSPGLSGPEDFEITPAIPQQAQAQLQTLQNQMQTIVNAVTPPVLPVNSDKSKSSRSGSDTKKKAPVPKDGPTAHIAAQTFRFRELAAATKNFRPECLLGEGALGPVYKGRLKSTGQVVAVKPLGRSGPQGRRQFLVEVSILSSLHHPNLVNLIGYCADGDRRLLVYEFMPLGSLKDHLHDLPPDKEPLGWNTRMKIAAGVAKGLEYLHDIANPPVIYGALDSSNIPLDEGYHPKLSDIEQAKLGPGSVDGASTRILGTFGYIDPEYFVAGQLTLKSDVYGFGVVLLELISGRKVFDRTRAHGELSLVPWARSLFKDRRKFLEMADPLLQGRYPMRGLSVALEVAAMCVQVQAATRPHIRDVVIALTDLASQTYDPNAANESNRVGPSTPRMRGDDRRSLADGADSLDRGRFGSPSTHRN